MKETSLYVHVSGGLLTPAVIAEALCDATRDKAAFDPATFAVPGKDAPSAATLAAAIQAAWDRVLAIYDDVAEGLDKLAASGEAARVWLREVLAMLGFESIDPGHVGDVHHHGGPAPLVLTNTHPDELAADGVSFHDHLQEHLNRTPDRWGLLASPRQLRVLREFHHTTIKAFVAFDLDAIFESRDFAAFRAMYRLAHPSRFDGGADCRLESLFTRSQKEGIAVGKALQVQVRTALQALANGCIGPELKTEMADPKAAREVFRELLLLTYRLLFLLFAEQRGMVPTQGLYADTYSMERLLRLVDSPRVAPYHHDLFEGLKITFRMLSQGDPQSGVFGYNGKLFDPEELPLLRDTTCPNRSLLEALKALAWVEVGGLTQRINYGLMAEAGVEQHMTSAGLDELGSVYESLLGYTLRVAEQRLKVEGADVSAGEVYLASLSTERKDLGAFYTPPDLVDFVLTESLDPLIQERMEAAGPTPAARERALLDLRVCDPSCGAGTFLIASIDRIALALAKLRVPDGRPSEQDVQRARRDALSHCIYGVDKDRFAVELCKFALWVHCAVRDLPLSFLDHRIQHGDALVGWPLGELPREIPSQAFTVPSGVNSASDAESKRLKAFLLQSAVANDDSRQLLLGQEPPPIPDLPIRFPEVLAEDERIPADVIRKTKAYQDLLASSEYGRWTATADLWAAAFFWNPDLGKAPTSADYWRARDGMPDAALAEKAAELLEELPALHWPLRFPEIARRGGFDCLVGNPPWEQVKLQEQEWFLPHAPLIAAMPSKDRVNAIDALRTSDPVLFRHWRNAQVTYDRLAEWMRHCGRFTPSGHEPNTYLLFAEVFTDFLRAEGRAGVVLKSGFAFDQSASEVFSRLADAGRIVAFHDFVNGGEGGRIFSAVGDPVRFAVTGLMGRRSEAPMAVTTFNFTVGQARRRPRVPVDPALLRVFNPTTKTLVSYRTAGEYGVAERMHRRHRMLDCTEGGENPWGLTYVRLFDSSGAAKAGLFHRREDLESDGWVLGHDKVFQRVRDTMAAKTRTKQLDLGAATPTVAAMERALPLYEGQLATRFDHRPRTYDGYEGPNKYAKKPNAPYCTDQRKADPTFEMEPRYWMLEGDVTPRIAQRLSERVMLGFRDVAAWYSDRRCAKACVLPRYPASHKLPVLGVAAGRCFEFLGLFNIDFAPGGVRKGDRIGGIRCEHPVKRGRGACHRDFHDYA